MDIRNKNVLITGASRGIGYCIAKTIATHGGNVALLSLPSEVELLQNLEKELTPFKVKVKYFTADLSDTKQISDATEAILNAFDKIDILINNAAISGIDIFEQQTEQQVLEILTVNLSAPILLAKKLIPKMLSQKAGHIVVVSSLAGKMGAPYQSVYSATKAGLIKWTLAMKRELSDSGVSFSVVSPPYVSHSGMYFDTINKAHNSLKTPKTVGEVTPQKVANAVVHSILRDKTDIVVGSPLLRIFIAINELIPSLVTKAFNLLKLNQYSKKLALVHRSTDLEEDKGVSHSDHTF